MIFRRANSSDAVLYFNWANDEDVRKNSYNQDVILFDEHLEWFQKNVNDPNNLFLLFYDEDTGTPVGQVRFMQHENKAIIGVSVDPKFRGKRLGERLIRMASEYYHEQYPDFPIIAYIKQENDSSTRSFLSAGYIIAEECIYKSILSYKATLYDQDR